MQLIKKRLPIASQTGYLGGDALGPHAIESIVRLTESGLLSFRPSNGKNHSKSGPSVAGFIAAAKMYAALMLLNDIGGYPKTQAGTGGTFGSEESLIDLSTHPRVNPNSFIRNGETHACPICAPIAPRP